MNNCGFFEIVVFLGAACCFFVIAGFLPVYPNRLGTALGAPNRQTDMLTGSYVASERPILLALGIVVTGSLLGIFNVGTVHNLQFFSSAPRTHI